MKKLLKKIIKKLLPLIFITTILISLNVYLQTYPSKILGRIIDLLSNINENKRVILKNIYILLGSAIRNNCIKNYLEIYGCNYYKNY